MSAIALLSLLVTIGAFSAARWIYRDLSYTYSAHRRERVRASITVK